MKRYCPNCKTITNRKIIDITHDAKTVEYFAKDINGKVKDKFYSIHILASVYSKCMGCDFPTLTIDEYRPKYSDESYGNELLKEIYNIGESQKLKPISTQIFPPKNQISFPEWVKDLPEEIMVLAIDIYRALSYKMYTLVSMGIRTLIDAIAAEKIGDIGGFDKKIKKLTEEGFISKKESEMLLSIVEVGHASSHRAFNPCEKDIKDCLVILNHIMEIEKLSETANDLIKKVPKRATNNKPRST